MTLQKTLKETTESNIFKTWHKDNPKSYLAHFFTLLELGKDATWQIGFYEPSENKIASFVTMGNEITLEDSGEIFKKEAVKINELNLDNVSIDNSKAIEIATNLQKEKYSVHTPTKIIVILQNLQDLGEVWNITFVTQTFNTLNIKINATTGVVIDDKLTSLMDFKQGN